MEFRNLVPDVGVEGILLKDVGRAGVVAVVVAVRGAPTMAVSPSIATEEANWSTATPSEASILNDSFWPHAGAFEVRIVRPPRNDHAHELFVLLKYVPRHGEHS